MTHHILNWQGDKPGSRVMEEARRARYGLMHDYCVQHAINHLFLGHHQDDQAETFLIRLVAGSGLDGLSGMRPVQEMHDGMALVRPFLTFPKERLIATCHAYHVPFVQDPSNKKDDYLRPRLRAARATLEEEGLSNKRLAVTAARLARARAALEQVTDQAFRRALKHQDDAGTLYDFSIFLAEPEEVRLRLLLKAIDYLRPDDAYAPRMERVEELLRALCADGFKGRTLGGCLFAIQDAGKALWVGKE
jgi:tRNA(Ile)-lysidine synthase